MRRLLPLLLTMLLATAAAPAQPTSSTLAPRDSLALATAAWDTDTLSGCLLRRFHFAHGELFGSNQYVCFIELPPQSPCRLAFAYEPRRTPTSTQARLHGAVAAVNGSFFDMQKHNPICFLRIDSLARGENTPGVDTVNRKYYQYGCLALQEGRARILKTDSNRRWEERLAYRDVMTAGPLLVHDGQQLPQRPDRTFVTERHNRTAIGLRPDGTTLLVTVDGRTSQSACLSLPELTRLMMWLGCTEVLNLDGGGSTTLYVRGRPHHGVVNYPTDNGRFDHAGERGVSSVVMVMPPDK